MNTQNKDFALGRQSKDVPMVVAIGASAGGLMALTALFQALPSDSGMTFVIVTHLDPSRESMLPELLQRHTDMPVKTVLGEVVMDTNHIYVNPPDQQLIVTNGKLSLLAFDKPPGRRVPIDTLFRSLAAYYSKLAAVILSGGGTDGSAGSKYIKENGGILLVQHPDEAEYDSMPRAAMATGMADAVLPVSQLAATLTAFYQNDIQLPETPDQLIDEDLKQFRHILDQVLAYTGHDFNQYKHSTILRRINRRMRLLGYLTLDSYLDYLRQNSEEAHALFNDLLIGVTSFFRDKDSWTILAEKVIPKLFEDKQAGDSVRAWVVGCATGEEAYTMAMLLLEHAATLDFRVGIQIFASDLNNDALVHARLGVYPEVIEADVSENRLRQFFIREGNYYRVRQELRDVILFANHNMLHDPPFSRIDLVSCRNLLIYLNRELQERVFSIFHYALRLEGYLFLGNAESAEGATNLFYTIDKTHCLYNARPWRGETIPIPLQPLAMSRFVYQERQIGAPSSVHYRYTPATAPMLGSLHQQALELYGPPSVLVDDTYTVLHVSETAGRYLLQPKGMVTSDLLKLVRPELQFGLRSALFQAFEQGRAVVTAPIDVWFNGTPRPVVLSVRPRKSAARPSEPGEETEQSDSETGHFQRSMALVLFLEDETSNLHWPQSDEMGEEADEFFLKTGNENQQRTLMVQLHMEVQKLRERLQISAAEFEVSNEELKLANEELQSTNEEYRSAMEELETSKEELQSVNEELRTVNEELKNKMVEVVTAHNDLENLIQSTQIATLFLDKELRIKRFTPKVTTLFNMMPTDLGRPINHLTHNLQYDELMNRAKAVLQSLVPIEQEIQDIRGNWFLVRISPYRTKSDSIEGVVITFVNISRLKETETELQEAEQGLEKSKAVYQRLFERMTEGLVLLRIVRDDEGIAVDYRILDVNPAFETILRNLKSDPSGKTIFDDYIFTQYQDALEQVTATGKPVSFDTFIPELDVYFQISFFSPEPGNVAVLFSDISKQKQAEAELSAVNETLEERVGSQTKQILKAEEDLRHRQKLESLGVMAGGIAHDFNNLLTPMMMYAEMGMRRSHPEDETYRYFEQLFRSAERAARLTRQILAFSRGQLLEAKPLHINGIVTSLKEMLARIIGEDIKLQVVLTENIPFVEGDTGQLEQVLMNLVVNAREAMPHGGEIQIETNQIIVDQVININQISIPPASYTVLTVRDNGTGMDEETKERLFEPFYTTKEIGFGLGLATVYGIVRQHGGYIAVDSELGVGTTVEVYLPVASNVVPGLIETAPSKPEKLTGSETILVAEDEGIVRMLMRNALAQNGYTVIGAKNGEEALRKAADHTDEIHLLLTDMIMPGMNGQELAHKMEELFPTIAVLYVSGYTKDKIDSSVKVNFLAKPFSARDLLINVRKILDKNQNITLS